MKSYILILISLFFLSCKSQQIQRKNLLSEIQNIIQNEADKFKDSEFKLSSNILNSYKSNSIDTLCSDNFFWNIKNFKNVNTIEDIIDFTELFDEEDYKFMKLQFKENKIETWENIIDYDFTPTEDGNYYFYSLPVFSKNKKYAVIYVENLYSGYINVLKINKTSHQWEVFAKGLVWIW